MMLRLVVFMALAGGALAAQTPPTNEVTLRLQLAEARAQLAARNAEDARSVASAAATAAAENAASTAKATSWLAMTAAMLPVVMFVGGLGWWAIKTTMRGEMARANTEQLQQINGTYVRSMGASMTGAELQRILAEMREDLDRLRSSASELHAYTHEAIHDLRNVATAKMLSEGLMRDAGHKSG